jgi:uncharacterized protein
MRQIHHLLLIAMTVAFPAITRVAAQAPAAYNASEYTVRTVQIPMRDGIRLHTAILTPRNARESLPFLFVRTPYGVGKPNSSALTGGYRYLAEDGFIFVLQDIRGRYQSGGTFVMQRPLRDANASPSTIDESTDAYDTITWLLANVSQHNARVGMFGTSYDGWTAAMAMLDPHPALKAVSPQASPADMYIGDDFHHNGAFRLSYGFEYAYMTEATKENAHFKFDTPDTYDWYLRVGPLSNIQRSVLRDTILPSWRDFAEHPDYDAFWQRQAMQRSLTRVTVPMLHVAGFWDQEDFYGPVHIYRTLEARDSANRSTLVIGPWNHGGWGRSDGRRMDAIDFGSPTADFFRKDVLLPFFQKHLKDRSGFVPSEALVFESGSNTWKRYDSWPVRRSETRSLYFHENRRLSFVAPTASDSNAVDRFVSDPANPVPYRKRPIEATYAPTGSKWYTWLVQDQRFLNERDDVVRWQTDPLSEDVVLAGDIVAQLFVSTTGADADWVVKLIDVYPDSDSLAADLRGYQLMVANDVFRSRYRNSFERPEAMTPNRVTPIAIDLHTQAYRFRKGHRIMVQVQSTWFPLIDRNPQTWVPNIFNAGAADFVQQTHSVWRMSSAASRVTIQTVAP